jgi:ribosomal protein S18 acetylase RimI-like enzyme
MAQHLEKLVSLTDAHLESIGELEQACNASEGLSMKLNWGRLRRRSGDQVNDFLVFEGNQLVGFLALYAFGKLEAEVSAMTHPDHRRHGIFGQLLAAARQELRHRLIPDLLFICEQSSHSGLKTMTAIGARFDFTEYKMISSESVRSTGRPDLDLRPAGPDDIADMVRLDELCFGISGAETQPSLEQGLVDLGRLLLIAAVDDRTVGKIQVTRVGTEAYISGFCVCPSLRGQGYGTAMLTNTVKQLAAGGHHNISLEVATENSRALSLYERCGFSVVTAYDYYRLPVQS